MERDVKSVFNRKELAEHLYRVVTSDRFLEKQGLGNEVPFFICPFPAEFAVGVEDDRRDLVTRVEHAGVKVLDLSLYDLAIEILQERDILGQVLEVEQDTEKSELKELLQGV